MHFLEIIGTIAFALSGGMMAVRKSMDLFGIMVLAVITAIGGGIIRDVLLGILPPFCFTNPVYILLGILSGLIVFLIYQYLEKLNNIIVIFDTIGLGTFTLIGTATAYPRVGLLGAVVLGTITGIAGGMIRDTMSMEIPFVLKKEIYASACILGSALYCILVRFDAPKNAAVYIPVLTIILIRFLAIKYNLNLPKKLTWGKK